MEYTNEQLYTILSKLNQEILSHEELMFPVKVNFYIQKNKNILMPLVQEIEDVRLKILSTHGEINEETQQYQLHPEKIDEAVKEFNDLFAVKQTVNFCKCELAELGSVPLTMPQMDALMFMIKEEME